MRKTKALYNKNYKILQKLVLPDICRIVELGNSLAILSSTLLISEKREPKVVFPLIDNNAFRRFLIMQIYHHRI